VILHRQGALDRAEPLYREALALERERLGESHPDVLASLLKTASNVAGGTSRSRVTWRSTR